MKRKRSFLQRVLAKVKELAKKYPAAVYKPTGSCKYTVGRVEDGPKRCGCLIGQALVSCRPTLKEKLSNLDKSRNISFNHLCDKLDLIRTKNDENIAAKLSDIQYCQDSGYTWSESIKCS